MAKLAISNKTNRRLGTMLSALAVVCQILVSLFFTPFVLGVLGDRDYGIYTFAVSITSWLTALLLAMGSGYTKYLSLAKKKSPEAEQMCDGVYFLIFSVISVILFVVGSVVLLLFAFRFIPLNGYSNQEVTSFCFVLAFSALSCTVSSILGGFNSYLYYRQKFILIYALNIFLIIAQTLACYLTLKCSNDVKMFALVHIGTSILFSLIQAAISVGLFGKRLRLKIRKEEREERRKLLKEILVFSSFVLLNTTVDALNQSMDKTILGFISPSDVTLYSLGHNINSYLQSLTNIFVVIYVKDLTDRYYGEKGLEDADSEQLNVGFVQTLLAFLVIGGFASCGIEFVAIWVGEERQIVFWIALALMLIYSPTYARGCATTIRRLEWIHKEAALLYLGGAMLNAALSIVLCATLDKEFAIWSCIIGTAISVVAVSWIGFTIFDAKKGKMKMKPFWTHYLIVLVIAGSCFGLTMLFYLMPSFAELPAYLRLLIKGATYTVLFAGAVASFFRKNIANFLKSRSHVKKSPAPQTNEGDNE